MAEFDLFLTNKPFNEHYKALKEDTKDYMASLIYLFGNDIFFPKEVKANVLAAILAAKDVELFNLFVDIGRVTILDMRDAVRLLHKHKHKGIPTFTSKRKDLVNDNFFGKLSSQKLAFWLLKYSADAFREVVDLSHTKKEVWKMPEFQDVIYGKNVGTIGDIRKALKDPDFETAKELASVHRLPWHYLRSKLPSDIYVKLLPAIAETESLSVLIRRYSDFSFTKELRNKVEKRILEANELRINLADAIKVLQNETFSTKTNERIYELGDKLIADASSKLSFPGKVAVVGDASPSMEFAIDFAVLIASILSYRQDADLHFFAGQYIKPKFKSVDLKTTIKLIEATSTQGMTAPATVIEHFLDNDLKYDTVVIITDECENTRGTRFQDFLEAWKAYLSFYPEAQLYFITVGDDKRMTNELKKNGVQFTRVEVTDDMSIALKTVQGLLVALSSPRLSEISIHYLSKKLDTYENMKDSYKKVKNSGRWFAFGECLVTISDLVELDIREAKMFLPELFRLKIIFKELGNINDLNRLSKLIDTVKKSKKLKDSVVSDIRNFVDEVRTKVQLR